MPITVPLSKIAERVPPTLWPDRIPARFIPSETNPERDVPMAEIFQHMKPIDYVHLLIDSNASFKDLFEFKRDLVGLIPDLRQNPFVLEAIGAAQKHLDGEVESSTLEEMRHKLFLELPKLGSGSDEYMANCHATSLLNNSTPVLLFALAFEQDKEAAVGLFKQRFCSE